MCKAVRFKCPRTYGLKRSRALEVVGEDLFSQTSRTSPWRVTGGLTIVALFWPGLRHMNRSIGTQEEHWMVTSKRIY